MRKSGTNKIPWPPLEKNVGHIDPLLPQFMVHKLKRKIAPDYNIVFRKRRYKSYISVNVEGELLHVHFC